MRITAILSLPFIFIATAAITLVHAADDSVPTEELSLEEDLNQRASIPRTIQLLHRRGLFSKKAKKHPSLIVEEGEVAPGAFARCMEATGSSVAMHELEESEAMFKATRKRLRGIMLRPFSAPPPPSHDAADSDPDKLDDVITSLNAIDRRAHDAQDQARADKDLPVSARTAIYFRALYIRSRVVLLEKTLSIGRFSVSPQRWAGASKRAWGRARGRSGEVKPGDMAALLQTPKQPHVCAGVA